MIFSYCTELQYVVVIMVFGVIICFYHDKIIESSLGVRAILLFELSDAIQSQRIYKITLFCGELGTNFVSFITKLVSCVNVFMRTKTPICIDKL